MVDFWEKEEKRLNKKKIVALIIIIILIIGFITIAIIYNKNKYLRNWIDINVLQKEKIQNNLQSIEYDEIDDGNIYAFNKYIGILNKNNFMIYDNTGKKQNELTLEISKPIFKCNNRYLAVAEEKGQKIYMIEDKDIIWEASVEGNISQITVNKNGYIAITIVDTSYKTVVALYNNQGEHLFNIYLSSTRVIATTISNDNKNIAIAEIDTSGTIPQSNIKIVSIDEGKNNPSESIKTIYNGVNEELITNIKFQDKNKLVCMFTDKIAVIKNDGTVDIIQDYKGKKISFATIELSNTSLIVEEKSSGIFTADSLVNVINSDNKNVSLYTAESVTKEIYTIDNTIALNLGSEIEFINTNGWLLKRYIAEQEINKIVLTNSIAGIVYRDKIEIINL